MEHEIVRSVAAAQKDAQAADALVRQYLPFIKAETAKFLKRIPVEGKDDEFGIAMFAFHEAATAYQSGRGTFLKLAAAAIRNRLIDYQRMEQRCAGQSISRSRPMDTLEDPSSIFRGRRSTRCRNCLQKREKWGMILPSESMRKGASQ